MSEPSEKDLEKATELCGNTEHVNANMLCDFCRPISQALADTRAETEKENEELRIQNNLYADEYEKLKAESERRIHELEITNGWKRNRIEGLEMNEDEIRETMNTTNFNLLQRIKVLESALAGEQLIHGNARRKIGELEEQRALEEAVVLAARRVIDRFGWAMSPSDETGEIINALEALDAHKRKDGEV